MTRGRRTNRIKNIRSRFHYKPADGKTFIKGLPVPHIPDEKEDFKTATAEDAEARMNDQLQRFDTLRKTNELTPEWKAFGERHGKE